MRFDNWQTYEVLRGIVKIGGDPPSCQAHATSAGPAQLPRRCQLSPRPPQRTPDRGS